MREENPKVRERGLQHLLWLTRALLSECGDTTGALLRSLVISGEASIESWLRGACDQGFGPWILPGLPHTSVDVYEFQPDTPYRGAVDLMIGHGDGSVSLVEIKDGGQGMAAVQRGVAQVTCAAVRIRRDLPIRRVVAWSPMARDNDVMEEACRACGVVPIVLPDEKGRKELIARMVGVVQSGARDALQGVAHGQA